LCSYLLLAQWSCLFCCFWFSEKWVPCDVNVYWNYEYLVYIITCWGMTKLLLILVTLLTMDWGLC
jgi:hypothetical protein